MSWHNLTPEQRGALRWLAKHESEVNNKEYDLAWRPGDGKPALPGQMTSLKVPGSLSKLNIMMLERQDFLICSWRGAGVKFRLTASAYKALALSSIGEGSLDAIPIATRNHKKASRLTEIINRSYDIVEFKHLCFELNVNYDNLRGETLQGRTDALILMFDRANRLDDLWEKIRQDRPLAFNSDEAG